MNILGVGGAELVAIFLVMLVVAGPKRMAQWAYVLGKYAGQLRRMYSEAMGVLQKELDDAGVDVQLPKEPPTRGNVNRAFGNIARPITQPIDDALSEVNGELDSVQGDISSPKYTSRRFKPDRSTARKNDQQPTNGSSDSSFGSWSNYTDPED